MSFTLEQVVIMIRSINMKYVNLPMELSDVLLKPPKLTNYLIETGYHSCYGVVYKVHSYSDEYNISNYSLLFHVRNLHNYNDNCRLYLTNEQMNMICKYL